MKPLPVPKDFHTITPYLMVEGAAEFAEFIGKAFGADAAMQARGAS